MGGSETFRTRLCSGLFLVEGNEMESRLGGSFVDSL